MRRFLFKSRAQASWLASPGVSTRQITALLVAVCLAFLLWPAGAAADAFLNAIITDPTDHSRQAHVDASGNLQVAGSVNVANTATVGIDPSANTVKIDSSSPVVTSVAPTTLLASASVQNHDFTQGDLTLIPHVDTSGAKEIRLLATGTCEEGGGLTCPSLFVDVYTTAGGVTYLLDDILVAINLTLGQSQTVTKIEELPGADITIVVPESNPVHDTYDVSVALLGRSN